MAANRQKTLLTFLAWTCPRCARQRISIQRDMGNKQSRMLSSSRSRSADIQIQAAPKIDVDNAIISVPARILPASPSYFTAAPEFTDRILQLETLVARHQGLPVVPPDQAPKTKWLKLSQFRSEMGETISSARYAKVVKMLTRLNQIRPSLRPRELTSTLKQYVRPGLEDTPKPKPGYIDEEGKAKGVGRRKESSAKVYLVEGTGEVLVNGRNLVQAFPRLHDRESALWALKITSRMDKYNVFALCRGGGVTGQAESITLALAKALLVHEPALKPALRRGESHMISDWYTFD